MQTGSGITFAIEGYEVSATFADSINTAALGQVKQILLSSFVSQTSGPRPKGILDVSPGRRYNIDSGNHYVP